MMSTLNSTQVAGMIKLRFFNITTQTSGEVTIGQQTLEQTEWIIGRADHCYLCLDDPKVSREHARIKLIDGSFYFSDTGSRWGSVINGRELPYNQLQLIQEGDTILLGDTALYIKEVMQISAPRQGQAEHTPQVSEYWSDGDLTTRCFRIVEETPNCKTFWLTGDPPTLFYYLPGQFVTIEVEIDGQTVRRPYSISFSPSRPYSIGITVKRVPCSVDDPNSPPGLVSNWLHDNLKEGDSVRLVGGAMGNFTCLPDLPPKLLLISAGSGIMPVMSMSRWFFDTASESDIIFMHSARSPDDIIFRVELEQMAAQMTNFRLAFTVTRPKKSQPWSGLIGRINTEMLRLIVPDLNERHVFCCGPDEFMRSIQTSLEAQGFPMTQYKQESFGGKRNPKQAAPTLLANTVSNSHEHTVTSASVNTSFPSQKAVSAPISEPPSIQFTKSNQTIDSDPSCSILETAEQLGIKINNACRQGVCGACKVRVEGEIEYDGIASALTDEDKKKGYVLSCIAFAKTAAKVEA